MRTTVLCCLIVLIVHTGCTSATARHNAIVAGPTHGLPITVVPFDASEMASDME